MEILFWFILATAIVFEITCISLVFTKADKPGWGCIVPIYGILIDRYIVIPFLLTYTNNRIKTLNVIV